MYNINRLMANIKNRISSLTGDGGQFEYEDLIFTWNWTSDPRYPAPQHIYISIQNKENSFHQTIIWDKYNNKII